MDRRCFLKTLGGLVVSALVPAKPDPPPLPNYLREFEKVMVAMDPRVRAALDSLSITTLVWEGPRGQIHFRTSKVLYRGVDDDQRLRGMPPDSGAA